MWNEPLGEIIPAVRYVIKLPKRVNCYALFE